MDCGDQGQDRISALPDPIIQHILSFLTVRDIIKTCVLSKRWLTVWTAVPSLNFYCHCPNKYSSQKWASIVDKTLGLYNASKIEKFLVRRFRYKQSFSSQADEWVLFATKRHVEELSLNFTYAGRRHLMDDAEPYVLPQYIFSSSSLRILNIVYCDFQLMGSISWTKLKVLIIGYAKLSNEIIGKVLSGSPMLESLRLHCCDGVSQVFDVSSSNLKKLVIDGSWGKVQPSTLVIEISAPNIISISLLGGIFKRRYKFNGELLISPGEKNFHRLKKFLEELPHVQKVTVDTWCLQITSICKDMTSPSSKLKNLTLGTRIREWNLPAIASVLERTPELETYTLDEHLQALRIQ